MKPVIVTPVPIDKESFSVNPTVTHPVAASSSNLQR